MDKDILEKLEAIEQKVEAAKREAADKGHTFIIIALIVLLARGCHP